MSTSVFFNNFSNNPEQNLIEDLVIESIKIYGHDVMYCPRTLVAKDEIYGEDSLSQYKIAYDIDMYIRSYDSYEGDGQFLSKFNLEIRDQVTFTIAVREFNNEVGQFENIDRPQEGDLIYLPMAGRILVIKYVNKTPIFYQMGAIQMYDLVAEMFEYSNERFSTGIYDIDKVERRNSEDLSAWRILTNAGLGITDQDGYDIVQGGYSLDTQSNDVFADNDEFQAEGESILDWGEIDPFSEGNV